MTIATISLGSRDFNLLINELMKIYYNVRIIPKTVLKSFAEPSYASDNAKQFASFSQKTSFPRAFLKSV